MLAGHDPYLVTLSIIIAVLGGYTGFGLAARIRKAEGVSRRLLLVGAAGFLSVGIWTMHFIGMMAAPLPADVVYLVLPTIVSFLICALVVGISLFFVSGFAPGRLRVATSAVLLGTGISSMHYVGIHGLAGDFSISHDPSLILLSVIIAMATAYGGLRIYLAEQDGLRLALCALAFGIAVSGMHYTAMAGMHFTDGAAHHSMAGMGTGLEASPQILSLVIAFLCFLIAAGFLLFLMPEQRPDREEDPLHVREPATDTRPPAANQPSPPQMAAPAMAILSRIPVQAGHATHFVDAADIRSVRADAHYTWIHDGSREWMCSLPISEAETALDPAEFIRVHRSYIVALRHVSAMRKEGDGAVVELEGTGTPMVPVSRTKIAEVKSRLGLSRRQTSRQ